MRFHERHPQAKIDERIVGDELELLPEFHHRLIDADHALGHDRNRAEIEMGMTDVGIERQRVLERGARPLILRGIAIGAPDEDVGLRDRPCACQLVEQPFGRFDFLHAQVARRKRKGGLDVIRRRGVRFFEHLHRLVELAVRDQRLRQQARRSMSFGDGVDQVVENRQRSGRIVHLKVDDRERLQGGAVVDDRGRGACERVAGRRRVARRRWRVRRSTSSR